MGNAESGSGEIEEEPSEPIFPLTRRGPKSGAQFTDVSNESEDHFSPDEEDFSFNVVRDPNTEIMEDEDIVLGTHGESLSSRGDNNRFLTRIQEEETDECDDVSPPHDEDSPEGLRSSTGNLLLPTFITWVYEL